MNYESVILELLSRVQKLESRVEHLENSKAVQAPHPQQEEDDEGDLKITRSTARQFVMDKLEKIYSFLDVQKGTRASGADILIKMNSGDMKGKTLKAKFYYSKSHLPFPSGWHTVKQADLENDDLEMHIFTVSYQNRYHNFFFTQEHLRKFVESKKMDSSNQYYFYFHVHDDKQLETRDGEKDVSSTYENWEMVGNIFEAKK
ncbi:hypothetical protein [Brevibacillus parabrevis]|uniref:hypothetical protein n=1 Tax=Brevibacillus parabrevis TaxID=54914 RepID=UPI003D24E0F8